MPKTAPVPTPESRHFWEGTRAGELRLQRCNECRDAFYPPRSFCPRCGCRNVTVFRASGQATLYSYTINHRPRPDWPQQPHSIAIVTLAEGPRMTTNIVGCPQTPEHLQLDMPLTVEFERITDEISLPVFRPVTP